MNILFVDDEAVHRMLIGNLFTDEGWNVITAEHGEEGLEMLAKEKVDIIVSDVYMPVMDGNRFYRAVRATPGHELTPFLFISAYDDSHTINLVKNLKTDGFVKKGAPPSEIKQWVIHLTTPYEKRPKIPPGAVINSILNRQNRESDRPKRR